MPVESLLRSRSFSVQICATHHRIFSSFASTATHRSSPNAFQSFSTMPTSDAETAQYLWACLENCGPIKINFHAVAAGCGINANAASVRYYRLRDAVKKGKGPKIDGDKLNYLWLCLQNNLSTKVSRAWDLIGTCSNSYGRSISMLSVKLMASTAMRQAFDTIA